MTKDNLIEAVFLAVLLFGAPSCKKESREFLDPVVQIPSPDCNCGSVQELGTNYTVDSVSGVVLINDYWMQVQNHCSQNTRRFSISQDQVITTYLGDTMCFYQRW